MGTNYYLVKNCCKHCNRSDKVYHIGKSSIGWSFLFRGYRDAFNEENPNEPFNITNFDEWSKFVGDWVKESGQYIHNEYGSLVPYIELLELITRKAKDKNHAEYVEREYASDIEVVLDNWVDKYGYSFTGRDFS